MRETFILHMQASQVRESASLGSPCKRYGQDHGIGQNQVSLSRSKRRRLQRKFTKLFNKESPVHTHIYESLAVSNAVELFKLIFLNMSSSPGVSNILAESLRHYSEHDLFAAFSYLRERKILVNAVFTSNHAYNMNEIFLSNYLKHVLI